MKIITDTAALIPPCEGERYGMTVIPVSVTIGEQSYEDYNEMSSAAFLERIAQGCVPGSSQPAIGDILEVLDATDEEVLMITVGDGLSGAYQSAVAARNLAQQPQRIHVMNSKTLAGPLRYMAMKAVALKERGLGLKEVKAALTETIDSSVSFVIPEDFGFLQRSGRLAPFTAKIGGTLKLLPILTQTADKTRITPVGVRRTWKAAVELTAQKLRCFGVGKNHLISVSHAGAYERGMEVLEQLKAWFPETECELLELSPALITHGGPGCIAIQAVRK